MPIKTKHSKVPLYILHGWAIDPHNEKKWQQFRAILKKMGVTTHFVKLPGLSAPLTEVWGLDEYVSWLETELSGVTKLMLLGHSFGGQLAVRYTAKNAKQVSKLFLLDSAGVRDRSTRAVWKRRIFWLLAKIGKLFSFVPGLRWILYKLARERDYATAPPLLRQTMSVIIATEVITDLPKVACPTLIIWGSEDMVTPLHNAWIFARGILHSQLRIISGARHSPQFTHPQETAQLVGEYIQ